jgi:hypothetical protein
MDRRDYISERVADVFARASTSELGTIVRHSSLPLLCSLPLKMAPIWRPVTLVINHQSRPRDIPQQRRPQLHIVRWIEEGPFSKVKWSNCEVSNSSTKVKNVWSLISTIA